MDPSVFVDIADADLRAVEIQDYEPEERPAFQSRRITTPIFVDRRIWIRIFSSAPHVDRYATMTYAAPEFDIPVPAVGDAAVLVAP